MNIKSISLAAVAAAVLFTSGCAAARSPVTGYWYSDVKANDSVTSNVAAPKEGRASAKSYLGLVALGDCTVEAAAKNGGITKISHVDYETKSYLGFYAVTTTVVHGE
jgi:hypothetical protein